MQTANAMTAVRGLGQKPIVIEEVLAQIQKALQNAQARITDPQFPRLESVVLTLETVITKGWGGKIKFLIFSFGMSWEKERAQELVLTLTPPAPSSEKVQTLVSLEDQLANAIVEAAEGVKKARTRTPPLALTNLDVTVKFVVTAEGSGGAEFDIQPVTFELSGNLKREALHKIELKFGEE